MEDILSQVPDFNTRNEESGAVDGVFSPGFSSAPRAKMYQAWVFPELHPDERQPVLQNWSAEELWAFCGVVPENHEAHDPKVIRGIIKEEDVQLQAEG